MIVDVGLRNGGVVLLDWEVLVFCCGDLVVVCSVGCCLVFVF